MEAPEVLGLSMVRFHEFQPEHNLSGVLVCETTRGRQGQASVYLLMRFYVYVDIGSLVYSRRTRHMHLAPNLLSLTRQSVNSLWLRGGVRCEVRKIECPVTIKSTGAHASVLTGDLEIHMYVWCVADTS